MRILCKLHEPDVLASAGGGSRDRPAAAGTSSTAGIRRSGSPWPGRDLNALFVLCRPFTAILAAAAYEGLIQRLPQMKSVTGAGY